jgi:hypothetical protein
MRNGSESDGGSVWPNQVRRKSVLVNEVSVKLVEREREVRSIVVWDGASNCSHIYRLFVSRPTPWRTYPSDKLDLMKTSKSLSRIAH